MKKTQVMLKFLFYAILGLLFFVPTVLYASKFLKVSDRAIQSFQDLAKIIESERYGVRERELASMELYMEKKSVIVGFTKNAEEFKHTLSKGELGFTAFNLKKPNTCEVDKACICLYLNCEIRPSGQTLAGLQCEKSQCTNFESIDFLPEKTVTENSQRRIHKWGGGFLYSRNMDPVVNGLEHNTLPLTTFYIERYDGIVDLCLKSPCISK